MSEDDEISNFLSSFGDQPYSIQSENDLTLGDIENPEFGRPFRVIKPEVQQEFATWAATEIKIEIPRPDYLMSIYEGKDYATRTYYSQTPTSDTRLLEYDEHGNKQVPISFDKRKKENLFEPIARIDIAESDDAQNKYALLNRITQFQEGTREYVTTSGVIQEIWFNQEMPAGENFTWDDRNQGRLSMAWMQDGGFYFFNFKGIQGANLDEFDVSKPLKPGQTIKKTTEAGYTYVAFLEGAYLKVDRILNGKIISTFVQPMESKINDKVKSLVPKELLADPIKAHPEYDRLWVNTTLKDLVGADWIHNPPPVENTQTD